MLNEFNCFLTCWKYTGSISSFMLMNLLGTRKPKLLIMKKILVCLILFSGLMGGAFAQTTSTYSGRVTDETGQGVPFATITIKGTSKATSTNQEGNFSFTAAERQVVEITALGYASTQVTLGQVKVLNVVLALQTKEMQEVIVSAGYGIRQTQRSTTSNAQVVTSDKLNIVRQPSLNSAIAGKVAGIQLREQSGAKLGSDNAVRLRGDGSLSGSSPVYIVEGTIVGQGDINIDDVEDVTVLNGPTGAAIYGPQAASGAIIVTLKKGKKSRGIGLDGNIGTQWSKVYVLPAYQNDYAGGANPNLIQFNWQTGMPSEWQALDGKYYHDYTDDGSWGPKIQGQEYIPWYAWYPGTEDSYKTTSLTAQPNNIKDFFNVGKLTTANLAFGNSNEKGNYRMSYTNQYQEGIIPTSYLKKHTLNVTGNLNLAKWISAGANITYVLQDLRNNPSDAYSNETTGMFNQWFHRDINMDKMRQHKDLYSPAEGGAQPVLGSWNKHNPTSYLSGNLATRYGANYFMNPYSFLENDINDARRDRLFGDMNLTLRPIKDLSIRLAIRKNLINNNNESKTNDILQRSGTQTGYFNRYAASSSWSLDDRYELVANYAKKISDFSINATAGAEIRKNAQRSWSGNSVNGLLIPDFFAISNSNALPTYSNSRTFYSTRGAFARGSFGYKDYLYVDATIRNDWFSSLNPADNNIFTTSFGATFIFSEFLKDQMPWLSLGKLRASWGETPEALGAYSLFPTYSIGTTRYLGKILMTEPNSLIDPNLLGAKNIQKEIGIDLKFLKNRFGISATYYEAVTLNSPVSISVSGATGYSSVRTNAGKIERKGLELNLFLNPISTKDFTWEINVNVSRNLRNRVVELAPGLTRLSYSSGSRWTAQTPLVVHFEGEEWGMLVGGTKKIDAATGLPVVTSAGWYVSESDHRFGSILPDYTGGIQNMLAYKNFVANISMDFQKGGKYFSLTQQWMSFSGLAARTAGQNDKGVDIRESVANGGGIHVVGVTETGDRVDTYVDAKTYFQTLYSRNIFDDMVGDLSYFKIRELSIGYRIPLNKFTWGKHFSNLTVSAVAINPWLINANKKDFDPSEISGQYGENGQMPSVRSFGVNLKFGL